MENHPTTVCLMCYNLPCSMEDLALAFPIIFLVLLVRGACLCSEAYCNRYLYSGTDPAENGNPSIKPTSSRVEVANRLSIGVCIL